MFATLIAEAPITRTKSKPIVVRHFLDNRFKIMFTKVKIKLRGNVIRITFDAMNVKKFLFILFCLPILLGFSPLIDEEHPVGAMTWEHVLENYPWMSKGTENYQADSLILSKINLDSTYSWVIFAGTWCSDTYELLPAFAKIANTKEKQGDKVWANWKNKFPLYMLGMDKKRKDSKPYKIKNLPTFILLKSGKEVGRIVETVPLSLEQSILDLVEN